MVLLYVKCYDHFRQTIYKETLEVRSGVPLYKIEQFQCTIDIFFIFYFKWAENMKHHLTVGTSYMTLCTDKYACLMFLFNFDKFYNF